MHVRGRRLISNEAAVEWRGAMERRTAEGLRVTLLGGFKSGQLLSVEY